MFLNMVVLNRLRLRYCAAMLAFPLYCLAGLYISGQVEGAHAMDHGGTGKVHRGGDHRAFEWACRLADVEGVNLTQSG